MIRVEQSPPSAAPASLPGERIYAIGDVHGRHDLLAALLDWVGEDAAHGAPGLCQTLVLLGDYIDRGPESARVLDTLVSLALPGLALRCLRGNHEEFLLEFLDRPLAALAWIFSGGADTLRSYGIAPPTFVLPFDRAPYVAAAQQLAEGLPPAHRAFLAALPSSWRAGGYFFAHAGVRPGIALEAQQASDLLWIDRPFLDSDADHGAVIVHGHTISKHAEVRRNRISIDTGAFATGRLTCLILERDQFRLAATRPG